MVNGNISYARFPITLDIDAPADTSPQLALTTNFFLAAFDNMMFEIIPMTGGSGKSKAVVVVLGRELV